MQTHVILSLAPKGVADVSVSVVVVAVANIASIVVSLFAITAGAVAKAVAKVITPVLAVPPVPTVTRPPVSAPAMEGEVPKPEVMDGVADPPST